MPTKKKITTDDSSVDMQRIKQEVFTLLTGQEKDLKEFDYVALVKRVTIILIAVYGIGKLGVLRQLAVSIAGMLVTRWVASQAVDAVLPEPALLQAEGVSHKRALSSRRHS